MSENEQGSVLEREYAKQIIEYRISNINRRKTPLDLTELLVEIDPKEGTLDVTKRDLATIPKPKEIKNKDERKEKLTEETQKQINYFVYVLIVVCESILSNHQTFVDIAKDPKDTLINKNTSWLITKSNQIRIDELYHSFVHPKKHIPIIDYVYNMCKLIDEEMHKRKNSLVDDTWKSIKPLKDFLDKMNQAVDSTISTHAGFIRFIQQNMTSPVFDTKKIQGGSHSPSRSYSPSASICSSLLLSCSCDINSDEDSIPCECVSVKSISDNE